MASLISFKRGFENNGVVLFEVVVNTIFGPRKHYCSCVKLCKSHEFLHIVHTGMPLGMKYFWGGSVLSESVQRLLDLGVEYWNKEN